MPKNIKEERYRWIKPIIEKRVTINKMADICPFSERTIKYWLKEFKDKGMEGLIPKSCKPKTNNKETPIWLKEKIREIRNRYGLGAKKIRWRLIKEGIVIHERTIGKILKKENLTRKYRTRKIQYKYVRSLPNIGDLVEIDIKYVPDSIDGKKYYQYTAIDCASRWRFIRAYDDMSNYNVIRFVKELMAKTRFKIRAIKTDNAAYFTNRYTGYSKSIDPLIPKVHDLDKFCYENNIIHYLIDPGKPQQNGKVERSHRSDQESFYDKNIFVSFEELNYKLLLWNNYYNDLEHCSLNGLSPNQFLALHKVQYVRT